jgi:hypothetical protein
MVFVHYADDHPLYTYAVYSPRTKRVLMRQDCIFLPTLFPLLAARSAAGMNPDAEPLIPFRSPSGIREGSDPDFSFDGWSESEPLPEYEDQAHGYSLTRSLDCELVGDEVELHSDVPLHYPSHPSFGNVSVVGVRAPPRMSIRDSSTTSSDAMSVVKSWGPDPKPSNLLESDSGILPDNTTSGDPSPGEGGDLVVIGGAPSSVVCDSGGCQSEAAGTTPSEITTQAPLAMTEVSPTSFMITLEFPGQLQPRQRYCVSPILPVRRLSPHC